MRLAVIIFAAILTGCTAAYKVPDQPPDPAPTASTDTLKFRERTRAVEKFFKPMGRPQAGDWLASFNEPGQTFEEYVESSPTLPTVERGTIYILPLGSLSKEDSTLVDVAARFISAFYALPVKTLPATKLDAKYPNIRINSLMPSRQVKTGYILNDVLPPVLPADAAALIALTGQDLYPDSSMNYVFGQATFDKRVGVYSLYRLRERANRTGLLQRLLKIATHETGHMFSMRHCTKYECLMSGTNHLGETDRRPLDACPECTAKILWFSNTDARERYLKLADICRDAGLTAEANEFQKKAAAVGN